MTIRTLLIDADILAYRATSANQRSYDWNGDGQKSVACSFAAAIKFAEEEVEALADKLSADAVIICLSDDFNSFRKDRVWSGYKDVRNGTERPVHLYDMKDHLASVYDTVRWTALEADDVMGIIATDPERTDERIVVSADKDLKGVPCKLYRPQDQVGRKAPLILDISVEEADRFHLWQTLCGDVTDGFGGCPGCGPVEAGFIIDDGICWVQHEHTFKSGPRKGLTETRWRADNTVVVGVWDRVVSAYAKRGLTEADAIQQARLARILRHSDWDGRSPRLWNPPA